jgi:hypothetical protein
VVRLGLKVPESNSCEEELEREDKAALWCRCRSQNQTPAEQKAQVLVKKRKKNVLVAALQLKSLG